MLFIQLNVQTTPLAAAQVQEIKVAPKLRCPVVDAISKAPVASIVKIPPADKTPPAAEATYAELVCTDQDKEYITRIITTLGENGKLTILLKYKGELQRMGAEVNHVHPFKFLSTIFSNPTLKVYMRDIYQDYFKWNGFMDGLGPSFNNQADRGKLNMYINDFAKEMNLPANEVKGYIDARDWEGLVRRLMD